MKLLNAQNYTVLPALLRSLDLPYPPKIISYLNGLYKSQHLGAGLEFSELREYSYGDDVRSIDWHASARSTKTYVKRYNDHRNQNVIFAIDGSSSMLLNTNNEDDTSLFLASKLTNLLMQLALNHYDRVSFYTLINKQGYITPFVGRKTQLISWFMRIFYLINTSPNNKLDWSLFFSEIRNYINKPSLIIVISDNFTVDNAVIQQIKMLKASKHKIWFIKTIGDSIGNIMSGNEKLKDIETGELISLEILDKKTYEAVHIELDHKDKLTESTIKSLGIPYHTILQSQLLVPSVVSILKQAKKIK